jgi:hypothetical protein
MRATMSASAVIAALALAAIATAVAAAEVTLWKLLPGQAGGTFKGESGKLKLQAKGSVTIECKNSEVKAKEGELLEEGSTEGKDSTLGLAFIHFANCTVAGLAVRSDGDSSGIILMHWEIHTCLLSSGRFGLLIKPLPIHVEVSATGLLLLVTGTFIAEITPLEGPPSKGWDLNIKQAGGVQEIQQCEGGEVQTLFMSIDGGPSIQSGFEWKEGFVEFDKEAQTAMA